MQTHRRPLVTHVDANGTTVLLKGRDGFGFLCLVVVVAVMEQISLAQFSTSLRLMSVSSE
jgi:hypothetical protein